MDNIARRDSGLLYVSDEAVLNEQKRARILTQKLNTIDRSDFSGFAEIVKELLGKSEGAMICPPFYCDYGRHIHLSPHTKDVRIRSVLRVAKLDVCHRHAECLQHTLHQVAALHGSVIRRVDGKCRGQIPGELLHGV